MASLVATTIVTVAVLPAVARASILIALDLPTLVQQADHIAVVDVASVQAAWDERHERIYSTIELKVIENWKTPVGVSAPVEHLTIVQAGGTVGDMRMTVTGMGTFTPGERSLVFLRGPANRAQVVGMTQGKRSMRYEGTARTWMVTPPDLSQAKLVPPPAGHPLNKSIDPALSPSSNSARPTNPSATATRNALPTNRDLPLDDLRVEIRRLLGTNRP